MQSQHNAAAQPNRRPHPAFPTLEEIARGAPIHSVHLPFLTTIPLPGGIVEAKEGDGGAAPRVIKIIYLAASAENNRYSFLELAPSRLTYEPINLFEERLDRMLTGVAKGAVLHSANILCICDVDSARAERQLKEKLSADWVVMSFRNEYVVAFNGQEYLIDKDKQLEGLERAERNFWSRSISVVLQHRATQQLVEVRSVYQSRPYQAETNFTVPRYLDGRTEQDYRDFFQRIPGDRTAIIIGVHGIPIAPLDDRPRNITTAVRLVDGKQQAEFYSGAFYCGTDRRIRQTDIQTLSFTTGEIVEDLRSKAEIKPTYTLAFVSTLDEEFYGPQQKRFQLLLGEEVKFTYEVVSNSSHEKKIILTFHQKKDYQNFKKQFNGDHFQNRISWIDQRQFVVIQNDQIQDLISELEERKAQQMVTSLLSELPIYQADLDSQEAKEQDFSPLNKKRQAVQILLAHVQDGSKTAFERIQMLRNEHAMREHLVTLNARHRYPHTVLARLQPLRLFHELAYTSGSVCSYLTTAEVNNVKRVSNSACVLFKEPLQNKQLEKLLGYIAGGKPAEAEQMIQEYPDLLTRKGTVKDKAGYAMHGTPLHVAFEVKDEEMAAMTQYYLMQQPGGEEEVKQQQEEQFPADYNEKEAERVQADLAELEKVTEAILAAEASTSDSVNEDGFEVINVEVDEHCVEAINKFHVYLRTTSHSKGDLLAIAFQFMNTRFPSATQLEEEKAEDSDKIVAQKIIFWRAIIGGIERFLRMSYAQALSTGIVAINRNQMKLRRFYSLYDWADGVSSNSAFCLVRDWAIGCDAMRRPLPPDFADERADMGLSPDEIGQEEQAFQEFHQTKKRNLELVKQMRFPWKKEEEQKLQHNEQPRKKSQCLVM